MDKKTEKMIKHCSVKRNGPMAKAIMSRIRKQQIMFYTLTELLDNCGGKLTFIKGRFAEAFNDEAQIVMLRHRDGCETLAYDADPDELEEALEGWRAEHPEEFDAIILKK